MTKAWWVSVAHPDTKNTAITEKSLMNFVRDPLREKWVIFENPQLEINKPFTAPDDKPALMTDIGFNNTPIPTPSHADSFAPVV